MSDLQARGSPQNKEKVGPADLAFVAFVIIILAIALGLTLLKFTCKIPGNRRPGSSSK
jgi:hypothetical protein